MGFRFVEPMAPLAVKALPEGAEWLYEIKFDGYRAYLLKDGDSVSSISRNNKNLTSDFPHLATAGQTIRAASAVVDGEIVALDQNGVPRFQLLQHRSTTKRSQIVFYAFDLLELNGCDLKSQTLLGRREILARILRGSPIQCSEALPGTAAQVVEVARAHQLEGVVAKRRDSKYEPGRRTGAWQKLRLNRSQEFVVGG